MQKLCLLLFAAFLALSASCSKDNEVNANTNVLVGEPCGPKTPCADGTCAFGYCRAPCTDDSDCAAAGVCLSDGQTKACRLPFEVQCSASDPCSAGLSCTSDGCRTPCDNTRPCDVSGQSCVAGACAGGTSGTGGTGGSGGSGGSGNSSGSGGSSASGGSGGASGSCGAVGENCCSTSPQCVGVGVECQSGKCAACGVKDGPCCGGTCGANLTCNAASVCDCGGKDQACCNGSGCNTGTCKSGSCVCGDAAGAPCCPGSPPTCSGSLQCAGQGCACIVACGVSTWSGLRAVLRSDGSVWETNSPPGTTTWTPVVDAQAALIVGATKLATGQFSCVVKSSNALCWGNVQVPSGLSLGDGLTTISSTPVTVRRPDGQAPLANVTDVDVEGVTACAVAAGNVYCWGIALGGSATKHTLPVLVQKTGGQPLDSVAQVSVAGSNGHACAVTTTSELWCWGNNSKGQLGIGSSAPEVLQATQVAALFNAVTQVSAKGPVTAARTNDGTAWVWGDNSQGQLATGVAVGFSASPVQVKASPGGTTVTGVAEVLVENSAAWIVKADGSLLGWGSFLTNLSPAAPSWLGSAKVWRAGTGTYPCLIQDNGALWVSGQTVPAPSCP